MKRLLPLIAVTGTLVLGGWLTLGLARRQADVEWERVVHVVTGLMERGEEPAVAGWLVHAGLEPPKSDAYLAVTPADRKAVWTLSFRRSSHSGATSGSNQHHLLAIAQDRTWLIARCRVVFTPGLGWPPPERAVIALGRALDRRGVELLLEEPENLIMRVKGWPVVEEPRAWREGMARANR